MSRRQPKMDQDQAEMIAIHGLSFLAGDPGRLGRFLSLTGAGPAEMAKAKDDPSVLASVLEYLLGDEPLLLECAANASIEPEKIQQAWDLLCLEAGRRRHGGRV